MNSSLSSTSKDSLLQRTVDLLRLHQQRSRFIATAYETPLPLVDAYVIIEIDVNPAITLQGLCQTLPLHKDVISRAVIRLEKDAYLKRAWSKQDKRQRHYQITAKGQKFLELHDQQSRSFMSEYLAKLSIEEIAALQRLQHKLCDSLAAAPVHLRKVEHPFEEGIRRVTRALGFIGPSLFGSKYSSTEWQIFSMLNSASAPENLRNISQQLAIPASTLSQFIARYVKKGLIKKQTLPEDRRVKSLALTDKGIKALNQIEQYGKKILDSAFARADLEELVALLEKHMGLLPEQSNLILREELQIKEINSATDRSRARTFLVFHLIRLRRYFDLPETIISSVNHSYALMQGDNIIAICEVKSSAKQLTILNCAWGEGCDSEQLLYEFLIKTIKEESKDISEYIIKLRHSLLPEEIIKRLQISNEIQITSD